MAEQFANDYTTALNGGITAGATALTVDDATGAPTAPFRIKIGAEIILVTAVVSNTFTVTRGEEGTTAAAHSDDDPVEHVLTAEQLNDLRTDVDSKLPAAAHAGRWYRSGTAQTIATTTETGVIYNSTVRNDSDGDFTIDGVTGIVTIVTAGWYSISAGAIWDTNTAGLYRLVFIRAGVSAVGGTIVASSRQSAAMGNSDTALGTEVWLDAGQVISVRAIQDSGANRSILNDNRTFLSVRRIGD